MTRIEVCTGSIGDSILAFTAGASRIELNSSLETGGLSPSLGVVKEVLSAVQIPVLVMIRPRTGNFVYSLSEKKAMIKDMEKYLETGVLGVVFGCLERDSSIDRDFVSLAVRVAAGRETVFHRAFDLTPDLIRSSAILADLGVKRILSSGGRLTAIQGRDMLKILREKNAGSIEILPGSGINSSNARELVEYTGCGWIHGSFSKCEYAAGVFPCNRIGTSAEELAATLKTLSTD